ncbi:MAG TPA: flagellar hook-basal body complex protein [Candidatus Sulfotelmatobacter sp.]|nr:flagellar hook-basal body complex protein [Candidatus Sulfotelmatobacter sp.]
MGFDSLFVGVSGLEAYQNQLDVISNNIANVSTTGYKSQNVNFEDLLYQAQQYASAPTNTNGGVNGQYYGLGVKVGSIDTDFSEGGMETTGVNTNLAINGDGFFILSSGGTNAPVYTRNGDFQLNENGLLYDPSSGLAVQGWTANDDGVVNSGQQPGNVTIPLGLSEQAVGTGTTGAQKLGPSGDEVYDSTYTGNLSQTNWQSALQTYLTSQTGPTSAQDETVTTTLYDSLGNAHTATLTYTPYVIGAVAGTAQIPNPPAANNPNLNLIQSVSGADPTFTGPITVTVNATGTSAAVSDGTNTVNVVPNGSANLDGVTIKLGDFDSSDATKTGTVTVATGVTAGNADITTQATLAQTLISAVSGTDSTYTGNLSVTVNAGGTSASITDGNGNKVTGASGQQVTLDGVVITLGNFGSSDAGDTAPIATTAEETNLPSDVDNVDGQPVTPSTAWQVSVSFADGTTFDNITNPGATDGAGNVAAPTYGVASSGVVGYVYFDQNGQYINSSATIGDVGVPPGGALTTGNGSVHEAGNATTLANGDQLNIESWGIGDNATAPTSGSSTSATAATTGPIGLGWSDLTSLATANSVTTLAQNGYAAGTLENITIGQDGTVTGAFTNGQSKTLAQVALATFQNEEGLEQIGSSQYKETANSGLPQVGVANSGQFGAINSGDLEESNVDLAGEFTKMIAAQNAYQANSKSITVASQDIQTAVNLIPGG